MRVGELIRSARTADLLGAVFAGVCDQGVTIGEPETIKSAEMSG